jgi:IgGFc binding protein
MKIRAGWGPCLVLAVVGCAAGGDERGSGGARPGEAAGGHGGDDIAFGGSGGGSGGSTIPSNCEAASQAKSYIGCEYWPTVTTNAGLLAEGDFAVVVGNPQDTPVTVTFTRGAMEVTSATVAPGGIEAILLPWVNELFYPIYPPEYAFKSVLLAEGAYRMTSDRPVTAYQFNPLHYLKPPETPLDTNETTRTNDASLILPSPALRNEYIAISLPTFQKRDIGAAFGPDDGSPGFVSIVAIEDGTTVEVTSSAYTKAGAGVAAMAPGETHIFTLNRGTVVQLLSATDLTPAECSPLTGQYEGQETCRGRPTYDLTGTHIVADKPIQVIGGHNCSFVPYDRWACDHMEEQLLPLEAWGQSIIAVSTEPLVATEPNFFRIVSGSDHNTIAFDPPIHPAVMLDRGELVEVEHQGAFVVTGTGRVAVAQFMVGEDYNGLGQPPDMGDPSFGLGIPTEQLRSWYAFLVPDSFKRHFVNVTAPMDAAVLLDGVAIPALTSIGGSGWGFVRIELDHGAHHIKSENGRDPLGITVSAVAPYTSYLFMGGLDVHYVEVPPPQ